MQKKYVKWLKLTFKASAAGGLTQPVSAENNPAMINAVCLARNFSAIYLPCLTAMELPPSAAVRVYTPE